MSDTQSIPANRSLAAGLRELADWLDAHPELPQVLAYARHSAYGDHARRALTAFADALGDRAVEGYSPSLDEVTIQGHFAGDRVTLVAASRLEYLGGHKAPVTPDYEPIIPQAGR